MADRGASGLQLQQKMNWKHVDMAKEYLSVSKSVKRSNAELLAGYSASVSKKVFISIFF